MIGIPLNFQKTRKGLINLPKIPRNAIQQAHISLLPIVLNKLLQTPHISHLSIDLPHAIIKGRKLEIHVRLMLDGRTVGHHGEELYPLFLDLLPFF